MLYLLDTNTVSQLVRGHEVVTRRVMAVPMGALCISAVTEGELNFGLARRPDATRLHKAVHELLLRIDVMPWGRAAAGCYGPLRAETEGSGYRLAPLDLMIAAHALSLDAVLVSNDPAFGRVDGIVLQDWTR